MRGNLNRKFTKLILRVSGLEVWADAQDEQKMIREAVQAVREAETERRIHELERELEQLKTHEQITTLMVEPESFDGVSLVRE